MRKGLRAAGLAGANLMLAGCGGGGAAGPAGPSLAAPPQVPAGSVLSFESGETGRPVDGATVVIAGRSYTTGAGGQLTLDQAFPLASPLDALAAGFLDRQAFLASAAPADTRFTLWPSTSRTGLNERFTELIVYTDATDPPPPDGSSPLTRIRRGAERVLVSLSPDLERDATSARLHADYAERIGQATGGAVSYLVTSQPPAGEPQFTAKIDPADRSCRRDVRAFTVARTRGDEIIGGAIVYCSTDAARSATVGHELGHTFGLNHSPDRSDLMFGFFSSQRSTRFSQREALVMRLMLQRKGGNRFPDNERGPAAPAVEGVRVFLCG